MAEALYNKYRPQIFEDVVGQEHIERTLKNAIASDKISHAYMFTGPRGTGKTTTARLLSKALICQSGPTPDPDGTCEDCQLVAAGEHPDVYELDAASRTGVENVREEIIGKVNYAPTRGRYKVYIIDEVHMLSTAAFNALLKTLEEPPDHVVFILCTTDPQKVPETILSRCQRFDFRRIASEELISRLGAICEMEGVKYEGDALDLIAHRAQGGMRDALTSLDQLIAFGEGEVTTALAERLLGSLDSSDLAEIVKAIGERDAAACFRWTSEYMETGADLVQFVADLTEHMRDMYVMSLAGADVALEVTESGRRELEAELAWYGPERLARMLGVLGDLTTELKTSTNQRLSFEIALTRMVRPESDITMSSLSERIETLERALASGGAVVHAEQPATGYFEQSAVERFERAEAQPQPMREQASEPQQQAASQPFQAAAAQQQSSQPAVQHQASQPAVQQQAQPVEQQAVQPVAQQTAHREASQPAVQPGDVQRLWASTISHLKKVGPAFGVIFMNTSTSLNDGKLTIAFDPSSDFAFKAAQKQDAKEALEKALSRAGAEGMPYEIIKGDGSIGRSASQPAREEPAYRSQPEPEPQPAAVIEQPVVQEPTPAPAPEPEPEPAPQPEAQQASAVQEPAVTQPSSPAQEPQSTQEAPASSDPDFQDFLASAFGEGIVVEEMQE